MNEKIKEKTIREIAEIIRNNNRWHEYDSVEAMAEDIYNTVIMLRRETK